MKPIIGILPNINDEGIVSVDRAYVRAIENVGGVPFVLPCVENEENLHELMKKCDGVLITGGGDVDPKYYGEEPHPKTEKPCEARDTFDFLAFQTAFEMKKPIFAICRGLQLANVALGGTLYQDLPSQYQSQLSHKQSEGKFEPSHSVCVKEGTPLYGVVQKSSIASNSFHHQAIKKLADGFCVMASADDGVIEAVYWTGEQYLRGFQWHPERLCGCDGDNRKIFEEFIGACQK